MWTPGVWLWALQEAFIHPFSKHFLTNFICLQEVPKETPVFRRKSWQQMPPNCGARAGLEGGPAAGGVQNGAMKALYGETGKVSWEKGHWSWAFEECTWVHQADLAFINSANTLSQILCANLTSAWLQGARRDRTRHGLPIGSWMGWKGRQGLVLPQMEEHRSSSPVFLPGESQGRGSLVGCRLWGRTELDTTEVT